MKYYVTATDTFLSGWGLAKDKKAKLVVECDTYEEAEIVAENMENRTDMAYINIAVRKPYYNNKRFITRYITKEDGGKWYTEGSYKY